MKTLSRLTLAMAAPMLAQSAGLAPNMVPVCDEGCTITAVSSATAVFQFGVGTTWGPTFIAPTLPLFVSYVSPNPILSPYDPLPNVLKGLDAQQQATAYTVTYSFARNTTTVPIPALPPIPVGPPIAAMCQAMSDGTFVCTAIGAATLVSR